MDDGRHGYYLPLLAIAIGGVLLFSVAALAKLITDPGARATQKAPTSLVFYVTLAALQVAGFAALEFLEGNGPDVIGYAVEALMALVFAAFVFFFISFAKRYVAPIVTMYMRRTRNARSTHLRLPAGFLQPPLRLAICAGIRRFKRPPPIIG